MKKRALSYVLLILGLALLGAGLVLIKALREPSGMLLVLPYLCVGVGCGLFGHGTGDLLARWAGRRDPESARQIEIEQRDERNVALANRAKAGAYDVMLYAFGALMVAFALMGAALTVVIPLVLTYLFVVGSALYFRAKYSREM